MKKIFLLVSLVAMLNARAQELTIPAFTQYLADNPFLISPAFAGIGDNVRIRANALTQWVGIKDAPDMQSLAADMRVGNQSGAGFFAWNDKNGFTGQQGLKFSFAHHIILDKYDEQYLSFGLSWNINTFRIDIDKFNTTDPGVTDDRYVINNNFDVSFLYRFKGFYGSLGVSNLLNKDIKYFSFKEPGALRNYQLYTGYIFKNYSRDFEIEPSAFLQYFESDQRSSTDLNVKFRFVDFDSYYWAGISYRFLNDQIGKPLNVGPMAGIKKNKFYFAYSYQVTTNEFMSKNSGSHMITVGLDIFQGISNCPCTAGGDY